MSEFLNNRTNILQSSVVNDASEVELKSSILKVVREVLYDQSWNNASDDSLIVNVLNGGLTNMLYTVENLVSKHKVIVRLFGIGTSAFINRDDENIVFEKLSILGVGPIFYGLFLNGRVEGYFDARVCTREEMYSPLYYPKIASALGHLHNQQIPELMKQSDWLWKKLELYFELAEAVNFDSSDSRHQSLQDIKLSERKAQFHWIQEHLHNKITGLSMELHFSNSPYLLGQLFAFSSALCHNDLLAGNVLIENDKEQSIFEAEKSLFLIDYEYAAYNFRAFDIANHFNVPMPFIYTSDRKHDLLSSSHFATQSQRIDFVRCYLKALNKEGLERKFADLLEMKISSQDLNKFSSYLC